jgi:hypothetical protein
VTNITVSNRVKNVKISAENNSPLHRANNLEGYPNFNSIDFSPQSLSLTKM